MALFLLNAIINLYISLTGITTMSTNCEANLPWHAANTWKRVNTEQLTFLECVSRLYLTVCGTDVAMF